MAAAVQLPSWVLLRPLRPFDPPKLPLKYKSNSCHNGQVQRQQPTWGISAAAYLVWKHLQINKCSKRIDFFFRLLGIQGWSPSNNTVLNGTTTNPIFPVFLTGCATISDLSMWLWPRPTTKPSSAIVFYCRLDPDTWKRFWNRIHRTIPRWFSVKSITMNW